MKTVSLAEALEENKSLRESIADLQATVEELAAPLGVPVSLVTGDLRQACKDLNQEREDKRKMAAEALGRLKARGHWVEQR